VNEQRCCDICGATATHELVQVYFRDQRGLRRVLRYCDGCYERQQGRHANNWLNAGWRQERDAPENQVRREGKGPALLATGSG